MSELKPINILLVEDDLVDVMAVKRAFSKYKMGSSFVVAGNGEEALSLLREGKIPAPRMVLLDLNMPRMNGIEFLEEIRKDPRLKKTDVFVLLTSKEEEKRVSAHDVNVKGFIVKERIEEECLKLAAKLNLVWKSHLSQKEHMN